MITRCACVRTSIAGCPEAWHGVAVDLTRHKERPHCDRVVISQGQRRSNNYKATIQPGPGAHG